MKCRNRIVFFLLPLFFVCCKKEVEVDPTLGPIVTLGTETLYEDEVARIVPYGVSSEDSASIAESYVKTWINDRLLYEKAEHNILDPERIDRLVGEYRKSLVLNSYQEQLLSRMLDRELTEQAMKKFYDENNDLFILKENIIQGLYLKIPATSLQLSNYRKWYRERSEKALENIEKSNLKSVVSYDYFYNDWYSLGEVLENIPTVITDKEQFLKTQKNIDIKDDNFVYLLDIKEYKLAGSVAPYDYVKVQVAEVFKEKKRTELLRQVQDDLYNKAVSDGEIKFYNK